MTAPDEVRAAPALLPCPHNRPSRNGCQVCRSEDERIARRTRSDTGDLDAHEAARDLLDSLTFRSALPPSVGATWAYGDAAEMVLARAFDRFVVERDEARRFGEEAAARYNALLAQGEILRCAFCQAEYPKGTPPTQHDALTEHVKVCTTHPMRAVEVERAEARAALAAHMETCNGFGVYVNEMPPPASLSAPSTHETEGGEGG